MTPERPPPRPGQRHRSLSARGRRLVLLFCVAGLLLNFPLLAVVEAVRASGWPYATVAYLFTVWAVILIMAPFALERRPDA
jgi:hypothetical protein